MHRAPLNDGWSGFQGENDAAAGTASDLIGILEAVDVPVVVVGCDLSVAGFNKAAAEVFGLSPSDNGRPARDVPALAGLTRAEEKYSRAIVDGVESRVDFRDGDKWFVVRISPYARSDRQVAGAVLTFTNVTAFRASIDQAVYERESTKAILNTVANPLVVLSGEQRIQSGNRAFHTMFRVSRDDTQGVPLYQLGNGAFELAPLRQQLEELLAGGQAFQPVEVDHIIPGEAQRTLVVDPIPCPCRAIARAGFW